MTTHTLTPTLATLHGHFSRELPPVLRIAAGDRVRFQTLAVSWGTYDTPDPFAKTPEFPGRDRDRDPGHALVGPVWIDGAKPGMTLDVRILTVRTGRWGFVVGGGGRTREWDQRVGIAEEPGVAMHFALDPDANTARDATGLVLPLRPFPGVLGMPPDLPGRHPTTPPRPCGGNIDCRELVAGSRLFLPVSVEGALFSTGDGHALQGDGEVAGPALECPMECIELEFHLHETPQLAWPRAETPAGWITMGFADDLEEATRIALSEMLDFLAAELGTSRSAAMAYASMLVSLRVTQIVNGVRGVHALITHASLAALERRGTPPPSRG